MPDTSSMWFHEDRLRELVRAIHDPQVLLELTDGMSPDELLQILEEEDAPVRPEFKDALFARLWAEINLAPPR